MYSASRVIATQKLGSSFLRLSHFHKLGVSQLVVIHCGPDPRTDQSVPDTHDKSITDENVRLNGFSWEGL